MLFQTNYLVRSKKDGKYLVARLPAQNANETESSYLLVFSQDYDALSYINAHAQEYSDRLTVETASATQIKGLKQRWAYTGFGIVDDPLVPNIQFFA